MLQNTEILSYVACIIESITKGNLLMVFMDNIRPIQIIIQGWRHGRYIVHTQIDMYRYPLPQHHKWRMNTYHNLQAYMKYQHFWNQCVTSIIYRRDRQKQSATMNGLSTNHHNGAFVFPQTQDMPAYLQQLQKSLTSSK